jgi:ATP-dependent Clp protease ATP-binding subunit ClpA
MSDRFQGFTERARRVLTLAQEEAQGFSHNYVGTEHLLLALIREEDGIAGQVLQVFGMEVNKVQSVVESITGRGTTQPSAEIGLNSSAKKAIELTVYEVRRLGHPYIGTEHILLGLLREEKGNAVGVFQSLGIDRDKVRQAVMTVLSQSNYASSTDAQAPQTAVQAFEKLGRMLAPSNPDVPRQLKDMAMQRMSGFRYKVLLQRLTTQLGVQQPPLINLQRILLALRDCIVEEKEEALAFDQKEVAASLLSVEQHLREQLDQLANQLQGRKPSKVEIARNLVGKSMLEMAQEGQLDPLIGRAEESERLVRILNRRYNPHALLVGEDGVGKATIVNGLVLKIAEHDVAGLENTDIVRLELEDFADYILNPQKVYTLDANQAKNTILFIPNFDRLLEFAVKENRLAVLYYLFTHLALRVIATATPAGYERIRQLEITLANRFQVIPVKEPDEAATLGILKGLKGRYEEYHDLKIEDSALEIALFLSQKYLTERTQPARALDVLDEACSLIVNRREEQALSGEEKVKDERQAFFENLVTDYTVTEVISSITGKSIPEIRKELFS